MRDSNFKARNNVEEKTVLGAAAKEKGKGKDKGNRKRPLNVLEIAIMFSTPSGGQHADTLNFCIPKRATTKKNNSGIFAVKIPQQDQINFAVKDCVLTAQSHHRY